MEKLAISVDELAAMMDLSRPKAFQLVHTEGFPKINVGRRILIPVDGLRQWLADQQGRQL